MDSHLVVFKGQQIRRTLHNDEWWFVVEDVVLALIDSKDPKQYIQRMKQRDPELGKGWVQIVHTLSINTPGGAQRMLCANTEGIFRIIQSIPSPKALTRTRQRRARAAGSQARPVKSSKPKPEPALCRPKTILPSQKRQSG
jgi:hypothetical protein